MKHLFIYSLLVALCLSGCGTGKQVPMVTAPSNGATVTTAPPQTAAPTVPPVLSGWQEVDGQRYFYVSGMPLSGWQELDGETYFFAENGAMHKGFLVMDKDTYYFRENGTMARGEVVINGRRYHFAASGKRVVLVNPWNSVPEDHRVELVKLGSQYAVEDMYVDASCYDALDAMLSECNRVCPDACVVSAYRSEELQTRLYKNKVERVKAQGYSQEEAEVLAAKEVAIPGTSEHQLGLAVDIVDTRSWELENIQAELPAQQWLMENCWRYGFVLRYPADKTAVTGIIYEPWHYRYVGKELAAELRESGLTLEEYLQQLTQ